MLIVQKKKATICCRTATCNTRKTVNTPAIKNCGALKRQMWPTQEYKWRKMCCDKQKT